MEVEESRNEWKGRMVACEKKMKKKKRNGNEKKKKGWESQEGRGDPFLACCSESERRPWEIHAAAFGKTKRVRKTQM